MKEFKRDYPSFALCGLNCSLCTHHQTDGVSKCPGCGGHDFTQKHPTCSVVTCNRKHDNVEYCYLCSLYPCRRFEGLSDADSYISYRNVLKDFDKAQKYGIEKYKEELNAKTQIVEFLIASYNNGRLKSFFCRAVNFLPLEALCDIMDRIEKDISKSEKTQKEKTEVVISLFNDKAKENSVSL